MTIQRWSKKVIVAEFSDDPQFSDEMSTLMDMVSAKPAHVILNLSAISHLNSSNISSLLLLRKKLQQNKNKLLICGVNSQIYGILEVAGLDNVFEFEEDTTTALAKIQIAEPEPEVER